MLGAGDCGVADGLEALWWVEDAREVADVLVLADDEREKVRLALVDTVRLDCSDKREADRWRFSDSYVPLLVWDGARCGIAGASDFVAGTAACGDAVKYVDNRFGSGDAHRWVGTSGLVGGDEAAVRAPSERLSSDLADEAEAVGETVLGKMSGAL